jgi:3-methyladenine DNA glycosylase/8-oxoguanine DNA glycosylase
MLMGLTTHLTLDVQAPFDFRSSATSYGWVALAPTIWLADRQAVQRVERLGTGKVVLIDITGAGTVDHPTLEICVHHREKLTPQNQTEICTAVGRIFRFDEDFSEFYACCHAQGAPWACLTAGVGRLLRSPTVFEDVVKTICTTNTRWSGTKRMVANLVAALGDSYKDKPDLHAFPTPKAIARTRPDIFNKTVPLGYRGAYVHSLAQQVASGDLDLEALRDPSIPSETLKRKLRGIKGVGPYATHTLMMLLGHYDELAIDAEMRVFVARKYCNGKTPNAKEICAVYEDWGRWRYLAYWFDRVDE